MNSNSEVRELSIEEFEEGGKDHRGRTIGRILSSTSQYIIYEVEDQQIRLYYDPDAWPEFRPRLAQISEDISRVGELLRRVPYLKAEFARGIGEALNGNVNDAKRTLEQVEQRAIVRLTVRAKYRYLGSSMSITLGLSLIGFIVLVFTKLNWLDPRIMSLLVAAAGSMGGFLSVVINLNRLELNPREPRAMHLLGGSSRIIIAIIGAIFAYFVVTAKIIFGSIPEAGGVRIATILSIAVVAGFSETFIPNLLRQTEQHGSSKGVSEKADDKQPTPKPGQNDL